MWRSIALALLVLLAGCSGGSPAGSTTPAETVSISNQTAVDRAVTAEKQRLRAVLTDSAYSDVSVPGYGTTETAVLARNASGVRVEVSIPVSYQYDCGTKSGFADERLTAVYRITEDSATEVRRESPICS